MVLYTSLAVFHMGFALWCASADHVATSICTLWSVFVTFSCVPLFEPTAYERMRRKHNWTFLQFHAGNVVLHVVPLLVVFGKACVRLRHAILSSFCRLAWSCLVSRGSMRLDDAYVPLAPATWTRLHALSCAVDLAVAASYELAYRYHMTGLCLILGEGACAFRAHPL